MSTITDRVRDLAVPIAAECGVSVYDVEHTSGTLRVLVDREGGADLGAITQVTRSLSAALDEADVLPNAYTLEVSSPGVERPLRTQEHFAAAVGQQVRLKLRPGVEGDRRLGGRLEAADQGVIEIRDPDGDLRSVRIQDIAKANVQVDWSPPAKPGAGKQIKAKQSPKQSPSRNQSEATQ